MTSFSIQNLHGFEGNFEIFPRDLFTCMAYVKSTGIGSTVFYYGERTRTQTLLCLLLIFLMTKRPLVILVVVACIINLSVIKFTKPRHATN